MDKTYVYVGTLAGLLANVDANGCPLNEESPWQAFEAPNTSNVQTITVAGL